MKLQVFGEGTHQHIHHDGIFVFVRFRYLIHSLLYSTTNDLSLGLSQPFHTLSRRR